MHAALLISSLVAFFATAVSSTALTYKLPAHEKSCFFASVEQRGPKIAFYFAVQSGGSFDIDYEVVGPGEKVIVDGSKDRQADFVFTANEVGEYRFCFNNEMSTFAEKIIDFEIAVENEESRAKIPSKQGTPPEQTSVLEESILKLSSQLSTINRNQKYFRTRENRNFSTVRSTERRIFNFSIIESCMMITMAGLQVFIVRFFFQGARKGECRGVWMVWMAARGRLANTTQDMCKRCYDGLLAALACGSAGMDCIISTMQVNFIFDVWVGHWTFLHLKLLPQNPMWLFCATMSATYEPRCCGEEHRPQHRSHIGRQRKRGGQRASNDL
ncbi:emp24/gp25L/p24 family/GOLD-domain-containing protein [Phyllosticta paracitricarpa]